MRDLSTQLVVIDGIKARPTLNGQLALLLGKPGEQQPGHRNVVLGVRQRGQLRALDSQRAELQSARPADSLLDEGVARERGRATGAPSGGDWRREGGLNESVCEVWVGAAHLRLRAR